MPIVIQTKLIEEMCFNFMLVMNREDAAILYKGFQNEILFTHLGTELFP